MISFLYLIGVLLELFILIGICVYIVSLTYSYLRGSFYVSTRSSEIEVFLKKAGLKKGQYMLELGSGDGPVLRMAAKKYGVIGKGIDINPTLNYIARFLAKKQKLSHIEFKTENVLTTDLSRADVIYIFLMPKLITALEKRLLTETKKGVLIISHGFKIDALQKYQIKVLNRKPFSTYFYKVVL